MGCPYGAFQLWDEAMEFEVGQDQRPGGADEPRVESISEGGEASCPTEDEQLGFGEAGQQPQGAGLADGSCESFGSAN